MAPSTADARLQDLAVSIYEPPLDQVREGPDRLRDHSLALRQAQGERQAPPLVLSLSKHER
jgi:hypothetical protein